MATEVTAEKTTKFLNELRKMPNVARAARLAGFARQTAYKLQKTDSEFAANWADAIDEGIEHLEEEAMKRATKGSDVLLIFLLKAHKPDKYREKMEVSGKDGEPLSIVVRWDDRERE